MSSMLDLEPTSNQPSDSSGCDEVVTFFSDRNMLPGLHVTLYSYGLNNQEARRPVYLFADRIGGKSKKLLAKTWEATGARAKLHLVDFTPRAPEGWPALHGNETAFGRLHLASLLPDKVTKAVYLDCDLYVGLNLDPMFSMIENHTIAADGTDVRGQTMDRELYRAAGLDLSGGCFNSGVLALNLKKWRDTDFSSVLDDVASRYRGLPSAADQGLLNIAFVDDFFAFGDQFNHKFMPHGEVIDEFGAFIYHFVGLPKPWDVPGGSLHRARRAWINTFRRTAVGRKSLWQFANARNVLKVAPFAARQYRLQQAQKRESNI